MTFDKMLTAIAFQSVSLWWITVMDYVLVSKNMSDTIYTVFDS